MPFLNLEQLLEPLSDELPCGESMEYDALFVALESASRGKAEQQYGDNIIPAEPPDWPEVYRLGMMLAEQTKDLRVACFLARALLALEGLAPFVEGLALVSGYLDRFWDSVHPQLDPDDDLDPTFRVNTLSSLNDAPTTVAQLRDTPLVDAGALGRFSHLDLEIAKGEHPPRPHEDKPIMANIEAAFSAVPPDRLRNTRDDANQLVELASTIESQLTSLVGAAAAIGFENLREASRDLQQTLDQQCRRLGIEEPTEPSAVPPEEAAVAADANQAVAATAAVARPAAVPQEITSRDDVIRTLDRLCQYYEKYEPSSPLPLLLKRAKRLASMSFLDIIKDLSPDALGQARAVGGFFDDVSASDDQA